MTATPESIYQRRFSIEEYLSMESRALEKHEYYNGKITKMAGADPDHNLITASIIAELKILIRQQKEKYFVFSSDQKIQIPEYDCFVYPDAVVVCEKREMYPNSNAIVNPLLVVEVLSKSTETHDRGSKFTMYKTIPSFKEYILIRQDKPWVCASFREKPNTWTDTIVENLEDSILLKSINAKLPLSGVYEDIEFL